MLEKIVRNIDKSRFVITKVDSNNLNVYFELGLAMGKQKDVLLIAEKDLVLQLPSDLRNREYEIFPRVNGREGLPYHYSIWQQEISVYKSIPYEAIIGFVR